MTAPHTDPAEMVERSDIERLLEPDWRLVLTSVVRGQFEDGVMLGGRRVSECAADTLDAAAALIEAQAERIRELEGALERLTTTSAAVQSALYADPRVQGAEYRPVGIPWVAEIVRAQGVIARRPPPVPTLGRGVGPPQSKTRRP